MMNKSERNIQWLYHFIEVAKLVSSMSKDPSKKIGAVIVDDHKRIVSTGFNGFPRNINDTEERLNDKDLKRSITLHAEENAILHAKQDLSNCDIYIYGLPPCSHCAAMIIQTGIKNIFYKIPDEYIISDHWKESFNISKTILEEAGVILHNVCE